MDGQAVFAAPARERRAVADLLESLDERRLATSRMPATPRPPPGPPVAAAPSAYDRPSSSPSAVTASRP